jgi:mannitol-specific phosphotransferase system IIBC component
MIKIVFLVSWIVKTLVLEQLLKEVVLICVEYRKILFLTNVWSAKIF